MYSKEELLIFSFINSNYDISIQNLTYKIFNFSNKENKNFFKSYPNGNIKINIDWDKGKGYYNAVFYDGKNNN